MIAFALATRPAWHKLKWVTFMNNGTDLPVTAIVAELRKLIESHQSSVPRLAFDVDETAKALGTTRRTVEGLIARGDLRSRRIGRALYVSRVEIDRFLGTCQ